GAPDFYLLSRRAREALSRMPEQHRFLRGMVTWLGFPRAQVSYRPPPRFAGTSKYTLGAMLRLATDALFAFSRAPLRLLGWLGLALCIGSAGLGALVAAHVLAAESVPTALWVTALVLFACGLQLGALSVVGGYVARAFQA